VSAEVGTVERNDVGIRRKISHGGGAVSLVGQDGPAERALGQADDTGAGLEVWRLRDCLRGFRCWGKAYRRNKKRIQRWNEKREEQHRLYISKFVFEWLRWCK